MNTDYIINQLSSNKKNFQNLFSNIPEEIIHWRNEEGKWNLLEIACHLYDEEREDFRQRLHQVLEDPEKPLPKIDPQEWVISRKYDSKNLTQVVEDFLKERDQSIVWLRSLRKPAWDNIHHHPQVGPIPAKLFLTNWLAHDYLHFRQIIKINYDYLSQNSGTAMDYAGKW